MNVLPMAQLDVRSRQLRHLAIDALEGGERGHIGSTMSLIEIMRVLFDDVMTYDPSNPQSASRDRLILSKGHGCIALYALLADKGFFPASELVSFCRFDSILGGHPERGHVPGVEASTGSLGHGLSVGVGMAYAARISGASHHVFVIVGDGEIDEGSVWEAALAAAHHDLENLTVIIDFNGLQSYGRVADVWKLEPVVDKWVAFGFEAVDVDGHDVAALQAALALPNTSGRPRAVVARTVKGRGIAFAEHEASWHHKSRVSAEDTARIREAVDGA